MHRQHSRVGGTSRRGITLAETLACTAITVLGVAALIPLLAAGRSRSLATVSLANLKTLSQAHAAYAATFGDRQFALIPGDFDIGGGTYYGYMNLCCPHPACPPSAQLGYGCGYPAGSCGVYGYWLPCYGAFGMSTNIIVSEQMFLGGPDADPSEAGTGLWRYQNFAQFNSFVGGRFYDRAFFAPADTAAQQFIGPALESPNPFTLLNISNALVLTSYALSPSALFHPAVMGGSPTNAFAAPYSFSGGYDTPTFSQCLHPELKTQILEHNWLQDPPGPANPAAGGTSKPYYFNQGADSVPMTLFYDGHTAGLPVRKVLADNNAAVAAGGAGASLWLTDIPLGPWNLDGGYFSTFSFDGTATSFHVFTRAGILGRDVLTPEP